MQSNSQLYFIKSHFSPCDLFPSCRHCSNIWPSCTQYRQEKAWFDRRLVMFERSNFTVILKRNMSDKGVSFKLQFYLRFNRFYDSLCSCKSCISPKTGSGIILIWCSIKLLWSVLSRILFVFILHFSLSLNGNFWIWIFMSASMLNSSKCYNSSIALQHSWRKSQCVELNESILLIFICSDLALLAGVIWESYFNR